jgi:hypothetical protein
MLVFEVSAKTGDGMSRWLDWLVENAALSETKQAVEAQSEVSVV